MWWYAAACVWCAGIGFVMGLYVGWFSTAPKLTEQRPLEPLAPGFHGVVRLRPIDVRPFSRN